MQDPDMSWMLFLVGTMIVVARWWGAVKHKQGWHEGHAAPTEAEYPRKATYDERWSTARAQRRARQRRSAR